MDSKALKRLKSFLTAANQAGYGNPELSFGFASDEATRIDTFAAAIGIL